MLSSPIFSPFTKTQVSALLRWLNVLFTRYIGCQSGEDGENSEDYLNSVTVLIFIMCKSCFKAYFAQMSWFGRNSGGKTFNLIERKFSCRSFEKKVVFTSVPTFSVCLVVWCEYRRRIDWSVQWICKTTDTGVKPQSDFPWNWNSVWLVYQRRETQVILRYNRTSFKLLHIGI